MYFQVDQDWFTYRPFLISLLNISLCFLNYDTVCVFISTTSIQKQPSETLRKIGFLPILKGTEIFPNRPELLLLLIT